MTSDSAFVHNYALTHPLPATSIDVPFGTAEAACGADQVRTAERIIAAYVCTINQPDTPLKTITDTDLWTGITREHFAEMVTYLETGQSEKLAKFLSEFGRTYTWFGGITTGIDGYNHWDTDEQTVAYSYFDKLVCLGEALGVLPVENPEQGLDGNWGRNISESVNSVADAISAALGIDILPPLGVIPVAGIRVRGGLLHYRHINALYLASRIRDLVSPAGSVCEYGAGLGLVAFYLQRMGVSNVTLFDIPLTNVLSAYFLIGAMGADAVCLEGELERPEAVKVRANWNCASPADGEFSVTANQDSFPEVNRRALDEYLVQISRTTADYFLSINHEVEHQIDATARHQNVSKLLEANTHFKRLTRSPYWIRRGYVEELYRMNPH